MSQFVNWVIDTLASEDIIDLYFIISDLADIELGEAELCETAYFDAMTNETVQAYQGEPRVPIGKMVF